jgi:hypothetical protein
MKMPRNELIRLIALGVAVVLEGGVLLITVLRAQILPLGNFYPNIISVAVFVLPSVVGLLSRRLEVAVLLAVLPFWVLAVVYLAVYSPVWYGGDLVALGVLASRVAGYSIVLFSLSILGWFLRRVLTGNTISSVKVR